MYYFIMTRNLPVPAPSRNASALSRLKLLLNRPSSRQTIILKIYYWYIYIITCITLFLLLLKHSVDHKSEFDTTVVM